MGSELRLNKEKVPSMTPKNYHTTKFYLKMLLLSPIVLIKAILVITSILAGYIHCNIYLYFFSTNQWIFDVYFYPMFQFIMRFLLFSSGILYIKQTDHRKDKKSPKIFVTNHLGILDYIVFFSQIRGRPMAKKEFFTMQLLCAFANFCKFIPVDRSNKENRGTAFKKLKEKVDTLHTGDDFSILICPEMCVTSGESLLHFASGAFRFKQSVNPLVLKFTGPYEDIILRADEFSFLSLIDVLCCWKIDCEIHYMEEYQPTTEECENPRLYANNVRNEMAKCLNIKTTDYIYADVLILNKSYVVNPDTYEFESLFYDGYINFQKLDEVFKVGDYKKVVKICFEFIDKLKENKNTFLLNDKNLKPEGKVSKKGFEEGIKLMDYIIIKLRNKT